MAQRNYPVVTITAKAERSILSGHPWIYDTEITEAPEVTPGALVDVRAPKGAYLGTGFFSPASKIRVRLLSRNANDRFDEAFFRRRIRYAWEYRKTVMRGDTDACRVIFGEADSLPGLTVDRYGDILVTQTLSVGIEKLKDVLFPLLSEVLEADGAHIAGIYERNDVAIRKLEGLSEGKGWYPLAGKPFPASPVTEISENGIKYMVDVENGQKTGFFLDQKYNRTAVARIARGKRVLDCFTHTGTFALNAALGGAEKVTAVDISEEAVGLARENARRNGVTMDVLCENVFDLLPRLVREGKQPYDLIILDPPAFTKSRRTADDAERGYREINYRAMKLLPRGGYLATCSCSHFMEKERFERVIAAAALDAEVSLKLIEARGASPDHPVLVGVPETEYLKFNLYQVV